MRLGYTAVKTNLFPLADRPDAHPAAGRATESGELTGPVRRNAEAIIGTLRESFGPDVDIALDVAFRFKLGGAIKLAQALEPYDLMWLEVETLEPEALRLIRTATRTAICTGESLFGTLGFRPYLERQGQGHRHARPGLERDHDGQEDRGPGPRLRDPLRVPQLPQPAHHTGHRQ